MVERFAVQFRSDKQDGRRNQERTGKREPETDWAVSLVYWRPLLSVPRVEDGCGSMTVKSEEKAEAASCMMMGCGHSDLQQHREDREHRRRTAT